MFPPMTQQTERVRVELENRAIEQQAALNASWAEGENHDLIQSIVRLVKRVSNARPAIQEQPCAPEPCPEPAA